MTDELDKQMETLSVKIHNKEQLYAASMPYIKDGALFIHTRKPFTLGDKVSVVLELIDENAPFYLNGEVVWITPIGAQGGLQPGVGVQFLGEEGGRATKQITTYLAGFEKSDSRTDTM